MDHVEICLLQKPGSSLRAALMPCLASFGEMPVVRQAEDLSEEEALPSRAMLFWDISLFTAHEINDLSPSLPPERFGVVLAAGSLDDEVIQACRLTGALGLLVEPFSAAQVRATMEVALACQLRVWDLQDQLFSLRKEMENRPLVEEAKRVIMEVGGMSEPEAMRMLQRYSRAHNQKLADTARKVLEAFRLMKNEI